MQILAAIKPTKVRRVVGDQDIAVIDRVPGHHMILRACQTQPAHMAGLWIPAFTRELRGSDLDDRAVRSSRVARVQRLDRRILALDLASQRIKIGRGIVGQPNRDVGIGFLILAGPVGHAPSSWP